MSGNQKDRVSICLVQPPIEDFYQTAIRNIPLGLLLIGAALRRHSQFDVQLLDLRQAKPRKGDLPPEMSTLLPFYRSDDASPFSLYKTYYRFGYSDREIHELLPDRVDFFCISSLFTTYSDTVVALIRIIREERPGAGIIVGGGHPSVLPAHLLEAGADFVIVGEGEEAVPMLIEECRQAEPDFTRIPNLVRPEKGELLRNPVKRIANPDALAFADYTIPGLAETRFNGKKHAMLLASRGCPNHCSFCSVHQTMGAAYRVRSVANVVREIEEKGKQGFHSFDFEDDHFGGSQGWLEELLDNLIERYPQGELALQAMNGITASNLTPELLRKMKRAGFSSVNLSLVTPNRKGQRQLRRPFDTEKFTGVVRTAWQQGLFVTAYIIIGLPDDTLAQNLASVLFLAELPCLIGPSFFYLVPGTELFARHFAEESSPDRFRRFRSSYFPYVRDDFSRADAMTLFRICRLINFLKEVIDEDYCPAAYQIVDEGIQVADGLDGRQSRVTLGFALLELLIRSGKWYGTRKKRKGVYPLAEEAVSASILARFLEGEWSLCAPRSGRCLAKGEIWARIVK